MWVLHLVALILALASASGQDKATKVNVVIDGGRSLGRAPPQSALAPMVRKLRCIKSGDVTGRRYGSDPEALAVALRQNEEDDFVLLFVHVFKAAGSSVRALLRRYADKCDRKWVCLVQCSQGGAPRNGVLECRVRDTVNLKRATMFNTSPSGAKLRRNPSAELVGAEAQIIGGHYYYGLHAILPPSRQYAYVTVLREPVATWISGVRFHDRSLNTVDKVVKALKAALPLNPLKQKYANAMTYLVPAHLQHKQPAAAKLKQAQINLGDFTLVGLVESWEATIDMLQGILDADLAAPVLWDSRKSMFRNSARSGDFAGRDIVNRLRQDPPIWTQITQYLETENQLYAEALIAHAATCVAVLGRRCTVSESFVPSINDTLLAPHFLEPALINDVARTAQGKQPARLLSLVRANATIHDASSRSLERPLELKRRRPLPLGFDS